MLVNLRTNFKEIYMMFVYNFVVLTCIEIAVVGDVNEARNIRLRPRPSDFVSSLY